MKVKVKSKFRELPPSELCPCGSGKVYGQCCKQKNFQFGREGKQIVRKAHFNDEVSNMLEKQQARFREYYGRMPGNDDYLMSFVPVYNDEFLTQTVYMLRECGIAEDKIYAYYKSGGILP